MRVVWPNGTVRAEFGVKADQEVVTEQRLKGFLPVPVRLQRQTDGIREGRGSLGIRHRTAHQHFGVRADIAATGEWYKIGRDQLVPHDGFYDIRITAELWEVYYYDYLALMTVDHPAGTEIFVDERFVIPPAKLGDHHRRHAARNRSRGR